jgi:hypothetical protein
MEKVRRKGKKELKNGDKRKEIEERVKGNKRGKGNRVERKVKESGHMSAEQ